ncbi:MAG: hypothetical protein EXS67_05775 [Candidatus Margulisbacteria bacterium]|nr:hypothetical protein [Candidatus Margulisiibacteriota bacterium]
MPLETMHFTAHHKIISLEISTHMKILKGITKLKDILPLLTLDKIGSNPSDALETINKLNEILTNKGQKEISSSSYSKKIAEVLNCIRKADDQIKLKGVNSKILDILVEGKNNYFAYLNRTVEKGDISNWI